MSNGQLPPGTGGKIGAAEVAQFLSSSGMTIDELMLALIPEAQKFALPLISNFVVGAVALGSSGSLYFGANYEFVGQALSFTVHGEQAATAHAISGGETGMQKLAVSAAPCGYCRQFLYELTTASTLQILLPKTPAMPLTSLIPDAFGPADLGVTAALMSPQSHDMTLSSGAGDPVVRAALMSPQSHDMTLSSGAGDPVVRAALDAAKASYAPYTFDYSGVALKTRDGGIFTGSVAEDAAFNPSMSPLEAAVVSLVISGGKSYGDIVDAVLVEMAGSKAGQAAATRAALGSITSVRLRAYQAHSPSKKKE